MITKNIIQLLSDLIDTKSPTLSYDLFNQYLIKELRESNQEEASNEDIDKLINKYKSNIEIKSNQGKEYIKKRNYLNNKKGKKGSYKNPKFFTDVAQGECTSCHQMIMKGNAFKHKLNGEIYKYHPLPECFPAEYKDKMLKDKDYIKAMGTKIC